MMKSGDSTKRIYSLHNTPGLWQAGARIDKGLTYRVWKTSHSTNKAVFAWYVLRLHEGQHSRQFLWKKKKNITYTEIPPTIKINPYHQNRKHISQIYTGQPKPEALSPKCDVRPKFTIASVVSMELIRALASADWTKAPCSSLGRAGTSSRYTASPAAREGEEITKHARKIPILPYVCVRRRRGRAREERIERGEDRERRG